MYVIYLSRFKDFAKQNGTSFVLGKRYSDSRAFPVMFIFAVQTNKFPDK